MKTKFLIAAIAASMLLSSCSKVGGEVPQSTAVVQQEPVQPDTDNEEPVEDETNNEDTDGENENSAEEAQDPVFQIDLSLKPNELGEVMILMYHGIGDQESDWQRTPENFRKDLEYMYQNKYQMISLNDYAMGEISTRAGYTPIILTFDDGRQNNFNYIEENGKLVIDPDCAVGILQEFREKYPDFDVTASFFLGTNIFGQKEYEEEKLRFLVDNGYDIGNHTYSHNKLELLESTEIQKEIGAVNNIINRLVPDYDVETLALPHGSNPKDEYVSSMLEGQYENIKYKMTAVLDVGWRPAFSPFDSMNNFKSLYRVTASETKVDNCGMYDYFSQFEENKRERFISDGNPNVVTIPKKHEEYLNMEMVGNRTVNIYE
ncbi:MAG: polysaccharide deacetylase family protein [Sedimentibacter sp.]|uniref:polysaccharide deacetylase family protein n=1 Tax=Sedimentibacter sp. TaxID=1960295 RepID=UPI0031587B6B